MPTAGGRAGFVRCRPSFTPGRGTRQAFRNFLSGFISTLSFRLQRRTTRGRVRRIEQPQQVGVGGVVWQSFLPGNPPPEAIHKFFDQIRQRRQCLLIASGLGETIGKVARGGLLPEPLPLGARFRRILAVAAGTMIGLRDPFQLLPDVEALWRGFPSPTHDLLSTVVYRIRGSNAP